MRLTRKMEGDTLILMEGDTQRLSMQETREEDTDAVNIIISGELKNEVVHDFGDELQALAGFGLDIRLSLEGVSYISPTAMHVMLDVQKHLDKLGRGSLTLQKVPSAVLEAMKSTGITELLMIE